MNQFQEDEMMQRIQVHLTSQEWSQVDFLKKCWRIKTDVDYFHRAYDLMKVFVRRDKGKAKLFIEKNKLELIDIRFPYAGLMSPAKFHSNGSGPLSTRRFQVDLPKSDVKELDEMNRLFGKNTRAAFLRHTTSVLFAIQKHTRTAKLVLEENGQKYVFLPFLGK